jgi:hypothetical protein
MDLERDDSGEIKYPVQYVTGIDETLQRLRARLMTFAGEWILDSRVGLDWIRWKQLKAPPVAEIASDIRDEALGLAGVTDAKVQAATFDPASGDAEVIIALVLTDNTDSVTTRVTVDPTVQVPARAVTLEVLYE